jgi:hypothetical protein
LVATWSAATVVYIREIYNNERSWESFVEGANFGVQTITTVGYGNWETPANKKRTVTSEQIFTMRGWSSIFMLFGATFYALFTGLFVVVLSPSPVSPRRP